MANTKVFRSVNSFYVVTIAALALPLLLYRWLWYGHGPGRRCYVLLLQSFRSITVSSHVYCISLDSPQHHVIHTHTHRHTYSLAHQTHCDGKFIACFGIPFFSFFSFSFVSVLLAMPPPLLLFGTVLENHCRSHRTDLSCVK